MATPKPQTFGNQLFDSIDRYLQSGTVPGEFERKRLGREAGKLAAVDPEEGLIAAALLAALDWDLPALHREVARACQGRPTPTTLLNAALACRLVNDFDTAQEYARRALEAAPANKQVRQTYFLLLLHSGAVHEAVRFAAEGDVDSPSDVITAPRIAHYFDMLGITSERVRSEIKHAFATLTERHFRQRSTNFGVVHDPDGQISVVALVEFNRGGIEDEIDLDEALAERLHKMPQWDPQQLAIEFQYERAFDALQAA